MKKTLFLFSLSAFSLTALCSQALAQRPAWVAGNFPERSNSSYYFKVVQGEGVSLSEARHNAITVLVGDLSNGKGVNVSSKDVSEAIAKTEDGSYRESSTQVFSYTIQRDAFKAAFDVVDVYQEGRNCWVLFEVAFDPSRAKFDKIEFTTKYGAHGLWRSMIIPGWGQMHKGSTVKGVVILVGEVALIGTTVYLESMRSDNFRKSQETTNLTIIKEYRNRADSWALYRNVALGAAVGLYAYNLVDAIVAPGAKRVVVRRYAFAPVVTPEYAGVGVMIRF